MTRRIEVPVSLLIVLGMTLSAVAWNSPTRQQPDDKAYRTADVPFAITGSYSAIADRELHRITTAEQWREAWVRHIGERIEKDSYGDAVMPVVDFDRFMVVAIFNGEGWNTRSMELVEQAETDDCLYLRFDALTYQTMDINHEPMAAPAGATADDIARLALERMIEQDKQREAEKHTDPNFTRAYGLFVLPRSAKPLVLFENVQNLFGQPPIWKEQKRWPEP